MEETNNITPDTPEVPQESTGSEEFSFDEVIYGEKKTEAQPSNEAPAQPQQVEGQAQPSGEPYQAKNDDKRFEYWQSRAAQLENQLKKVEPIVNNYVQNANQQQAAPAEPEQKEEFPPAPEKPRRPVGYSRESAYTDPNSVSAQYENEVEDWRDRMDEYNNLRVQYSEAIMNEKVQEIDKARKAESQRVQQARKMNAERSRASEYVQANYGMNQEEARDFVTKFSNPSSITMDNLVQLYNIQRSAGSAPPVAPNNTGNTQSGIPTGPSPDFIQTQRAQQVPQPMGVMPSGTNPNNETSDRDKAKGFMADLIDFNDKKTAF
jgi:hypothetical protein